jgi:hypothetical protein
MNNLKKLFLFIASVLLIIVLFSFVMNSISEPSVDISVDNILQNYFSSHTMKKNNDIDFDTYFTENDFIRLKQKLPILDEVRFELSSDKLELYEKLTPNDSTIVIYPIFTSAAYSDSGFYAFFSGDCDESCLNNISFKNPDINYNSSGITT